MPERCWPCNARATLAAPTPAQAACAAMQKLIASRYSYDISMRGDGCDTIGNSLLPLETDERLLIMRILRDAGKVPDGIPDSKPIGQAVLDKLAAAQVVIDKLPTYADTSEPFVPGRDEAWIETYAAGPSHLAYMSWCPDHQGGRGEWHYFTDDVDDIESAFVGPAYSTRAALALVVAMKEIKP